MKVALAQINPIVGDLTHNQKLIIEFIQKSKTANADVVVFPELSICGYPPEDLLFHCDFIQRAQSAVEQIIKEHSKDILLILGCPRMQNNEIFNSAFIGSDGLVIETYDKVFLPNYGVFDEKRYFKAGNSYPLIAFKEKKIAISICEDIWIDQWFNNPSINNADFLINISASPYCNTKIETRKKLVSKVSQSIKKPLFLCNIVGGQDELVFDGNSLVCNSNGKIIAKGKHCNSDLIISELNQNKPISDSTDDKLKEIFEVLKLGVYDYVHKNGFNRVLLGLSGGIDSALNLALLSQCFDAKNILAVILPTRFNAKQSSIDAIKQCETLNIAYKVFEIEHLFKTYIDEFNKNNQSLSGLSLQNIQARIRANVLMGIANETNSLLITTSNKSEIAVGYSTIYGDMAGAFCPLKDIQKTLVYQLAHWLNFYFKKEMIPQLVIDKEPSAELADNQKDKDSLPEYLVLDEIMNLFCEKKMSRAEIYQFQNKADVDRVIDLIERNEYKRFQSSPGIKITSSSFTKDWRYPISKRH